MLQWRQDFSRLVGGKPRERWRADILSLGSRGGGKAYTEIKGGEKGKSRTKMMGIKSEQFLKVARG